ncbi:hypothetical protein HDE_05157 [Halotydeus destructor]|nr:hypothetical protein HDE_05157 [Halotydeus destructor]
MNKPRKFKKDGDITLTEFEKRAQLEAAKHRLRCYAEAEQDFISGQLREISQLRIEARNLDDELEVAKKGYTDSLHMSFPDLIPLIELSSDECMSFTENEFDKLFRESLRKFEEEDLKAVALLDTFSRTLIDWKRNKRIEEVHFPPNEDIVRLRKEIAIAKEDANQVKDKWQALAKAFIMFAKDTKLQEKVSLAAMEEMCDIVDTNFSELYVGFEERKKIPDDDSGDLFFETISESCAANGANVRLSKRLKARTESILKDMAITSPTVSVPESIFKFTNELESMNENCRSSYPASVTK